MVAIPSRVLLFRCLLLCVLARLGKTGASCSDIRPFVLANRILRRTSEALFPASSEGRMAVKSYKQVTLVFRDRVGAAVERFVFTVLITPGAGVLSVTLLPMMPSILYLLVYTLVANQAVLQSKGPFAGLTFVRSLP